jgi:hypothetical protein
VAITGAAPYVGRTHVAHLIGGVRSPSTTLYCAYGIDSTAPVDTDGRLGAEIARGIATVTPTAGGSFEATYVFTIPYDLTVGEVGLYNVYGELIYREGGMAVAKEEDDSYTVTVAIDVDSYIGNRFTTGGVTEVRDLIINNSSPVAFTFIAFGTGVTAESAAHTTLATETERVAVTVYLLSILAPFDTIRFAGLFSAVASTTTVSEVAIFNASSGGDMLLRELIDNPVEIPAAQKPVVVIDVILGGDTDTV